MSGAVSAFNPFSSNPIGALTGTIGMFQGSKASDRAANHQVSGMQAAQAELDPYMQSGKQANTMLQNQLSSGQLGGSFNPGNLTEDPGYKFRLEQGEQALGRKQSAGGSYYSGAALKEAQRFGQGLADQTYNDAYNRWLQQQQNTYNMLSGQQNQGQTAATNYGKYSTGIGEVNAENTIAKNNIRQKGMASILGNLGFGG